MRTSRLTKACNERGGFHARATPRRMKRVPVSDMGLNQRDSTACFYIRNNNDARERERESDGQPRGHERFLTKGEHGWRPAAKCTISSNFIIDAIMRP